MQNRALRRSRTKVQRPAPSPLRAIGSARRRRVTWFAGTLMALAHATAAAAASDPEGATRLAQVSELRIDVAPMLVAQEASQLALRIELGPAGAVPQLSFLRLRGLPPVVSLSEGHSVGPGSWAVPLNTLPRLKANVPAGVAGRSNLVVSLLSIDGRLLAETTTVLVVKAAMTAAPADLALGAQAAERPEPGPAKPAAKSTVPTGSEAPGRPQNLSPAAKSAAEQLIVQGERYLAQGTLAAARLFFRQAADAGLALGAMRLGATYDPGELAKLKTRGVLPDVAEARRWYERARQLGAPDAEQRLARLGSP
jgi:TPR repeat protein